MEAKCLAWNLLELVFYSKFCFARPDSDGNKLAKDKLRREKQEIKKCLSIVSRVVNFIFLNLTWCRKG